MPRETEQPLIKIPCLPLIAGAYVGMALNILLMTLKHRKEDANYLKLCQGNLDNPQNTCTLFAATIEWFLILMLPAVCYGATLHKLYLSQESRQLTTPIRIYHTLSLLRLTVWQIGIYKQFREFKHSNGQPSQLVFILTFIVSILAKLALKSCHRHELRLNKKLTDMLIIATGLLVLSSLTLTGVGCLYNSAPAEIIPTGAQPRLQL